MTVGPSYGQNKNLVFIRKSKPLYTYCVRILKIRPVLNKVSIASYCWRVTANTRATEMCAFPVFPPRDREPFCCTEGKAEIPNFERKEWPAQLRSPWKNAFASTKKPAVSLSSASPTHTHPGEASSVSGFIAANSTCRSLLRFRPNHEGRLTVQSWFDTVQSGVSRLALQGWRDFEQHLIG